MRIKLSTRLERTKRWHLRLLLVGLSVFLSEAVTCAMGLLLKGEVSSDYLLTGLVVSLFVASLIVAMVGFFLERLNDSQLQLQNIIFNTAPVGVLTTDRSFHVTRANAKMLDMLGYSMEELSLLTIMDLTHGEDREMVRECLNQLMGAKGSALLHGKRKVRKNCSVFWADLALSTLQSSGDPAGGMLAIISDISERKQLEETLRVARIGIEHSSDFVFLVNAEAGFIDVNHSACRALGYTQEELRKMTIGDIDPKYHAQQWTQHFSDLRQHGSLTFESQHRAKDGRLIPVEIVSNYFLFGAEERICVFARDIAVRKAAEDQIKHWAFYDPLTLLANRRLLIDRMQLAMAASVRNGRWGALLFVDLDNFKTLNDTRGHDVGDLLLLQVAQRLGACVRECDTVARLGGDEFVVVLPNLSEDVREAATQASIAGTKVLASLDQAFQLAGQQHKSTASIGATLFINQETTVDELIKQADIAMYKAKAAGRNALRFHQLHADVSLGSRTKISVSDILKTI